MKTKTKGLIIREQTVGENDRLVTLLSEDFGLVRAFARRAKSIKSSNTSATSLFAYGEFTLYKGSDSNVIESAQPIEIFFELRGDIERLALAQYFAQLTYYLGSEEQPSHEMLRLMLNSLHLLCKSNKSLMHIKAALEMRMLCLGGYMPDIVACYRCGKYESEVMSFDIQEGCIYCDECYRNNAVVAPLSVITAIRYICLTEDVSKVFSFRLSDENTKLLSDICERYLLSRVEGKLTTLEFYKSLKL